MEIWAHRGASGYAPENTLEAFKLAIEMEVDGIELDVQLTKDNKVVVIHDETLQRVSNGQGYVKDFTLAELKELNFNKDNARYPELEIPTLREVLQLLRNTDIKLNIELKTGVFFYPELEQKVLELVDKYDMKDRVWYSSFNHYSMKKILELDANAKVGLLYVDGIYEPVEYAKKLGAKALHPYVNNLQYPDLISKCKENEIKIHTWTVNGYRDMLSCAKYSVDAVITNYPDRVRLFMNKQGMGKYPYENPFCEGANREFYLFGAGYNGQHFLNRYSSKYEPIAILDNAEIKWGKKLNGISIRSPQCLNSDDCVVVAGIYYADIIKQLKQMGITNYYIYDEMSDWK